MCGITGIFSCIKQSSHSDKVNNILLSQKNRGPDRSNVESIIHSDSHCILGHNRLKIIDLSSLADQPMWDNTRNYCLTYNGEIYNYIELKKELENLHYHFRTTSDTEVLLYALIEWGCDALNRLNGPFAFAFYNKGKNHLWLARDRFGVKPLYYHLTQQSFYFASSSTSLAKQLSLQPNFHYLSRGMYYLVYEDGTEETVYEGLNALQAGYYLELTATKSNQIKCIRKSYYNLDDRVNVLENEIRDLPYHHIRDRLMETFESATSVRLRADVPIGISLSGGLDSCSVTAIAASLNANLKGFSFGHPEVSHSEGKLAKVFSDHQQLKTSFIWPTVAELSETLPEVIQAQGAPFPSLSILCQYLVYRDAKKSGIKVLLGGQGGDEAFMGYRKYLFFQLKNLLANKHYYQMATYLFGLSLTLSSECSNFKAYLQQMNRYKGKAQSNLLLTGFTPDILNLGHSTENDLWRRQSKDVTAFSLPTLLRYEDANSMGNSIESRLPFMDYRMIELGLAMKAEYKIKHGYGKWILRDMMKNKVPDKIRLARYKRGFDANYAAWYKNGFGNTLRTYLHEISENIQPYVNIRNINNAFSDTELIHTRSRFAEAITLIWLGLNS